MHIAHGRHSSSARVVEQCAQQLGPIDPRMLLAFCGGKHDGATVLRAIQAAFGEEIPVVGGSAAGLIWHDGLGYSGRPFSHITRLQRIVAV